MIQMSKVYDLNFLEDKLGNFDKDFIYPRTSLTEGPLFYIEKNSKSELDNEIRQIKENPELNPAFLWGFVKDNDSIYVNRSFGENKIFIYNPDAMRRTDYVKGKLKVLDELKKDNFNDLFDQKAVFDYFYKTLWDLRLDLGEEIRNKNQLPDNVALMEAQHIIDRIIFTYFVCQKRLISVRDIKSISGKELFTDIISRIGEKVDTWKYLKLLFFEQFAVEKSDDLDCGGNVFIEAPYLNGGLFREKELSENIKEKDLVIEYDWNKIFNVLNKYTWIIEYEIPDFEGDYEGNLTPEIMGHIYEKFVISLEVLEEINIDDLSISDSGDLKKGNKKIGAYYTPEYITDYISRKTINPYLFEKIGIDSENNFDLVIKNINSDELNHAFKILNEIKICDPACGSGAFLIKAGEVLLEYKLEILKHLNIDYDRYELKKDIIINNLYGADIQEGAVEICKLRLWLWLISSSKDKKVEILPNIEYNFLIGNSLLGWVDEDLDQNILIHVDEKDIRPLIALKMGFESDQKKLIDEAIEYLNKTDVKSYAKAFSLLKDLYSYSAGENAEILKKTIEWIKEAIYNKVNGIYYDYLISKVQNISYDDFKDFVPIHWKVDFFDIFEDTGFDILLGNPPYGGILKREKGTLLNNTLKKQFVSASGKYDIYVLFLERGIKWMKDNGKLGYIVQNRFLRADYAKNLRSFILNNSKLEIIIDFGDTKIFEGATNYPAIIIFDKHLDIANKVDFVEVKEQAKALSPKEIVNIIKSPFKNKEYLSIVEINQELLKGLRSWTPAQIQINLILNNVTGIRLLGDLTEEIMQGVTFGGEGSDSIFYIRKDKTKEFNIENKMLKKALKGKNIKKWNLDWSENFIIYPYDSNGKEVNLEKFQNTKIYLNKYKKKLSERVLDGKNITEWSKSWFAFWRVRNPIVFENVKILTPRLSNENSFALDNLGEYYFTDSAIAIIPKFLDKYYLIGILNSNLLSYFVKNTSPFVQGRYYSFTKTYLEKLPIKIPDNIQENNLKEQIIEKVKKLMELNNNTSINEEISEIENEINNLVYKLYGLTHEEICIIEE